KEHYDRHHNVGRAMSYSGLTTTTGVAAGAIGASVGTGLATSAGFAATSIVAGFAAPLVGAVAVIGAKAIYENVKPVRRAIDSVGDALNNIGKSFSSALKWG
ncbi:hypothetical protein HK327_05775, partial [Streptococcus agalactiae]|nr:hypothetical protein [Streptococcus agalactiae]